MSGKEKLFYQQNFLISKKWQFFWPNSFRQASMLRYCKKVSVSGMFSEMGSELVNPFMHNVVKWPNILYKSFDVHTARFLKYVWPFYNIMHERVKGTD